MVKESMKLFGSTRMVKRFLWLPKTIDGEIRWMSTQKWVEVFRQDPYMPIYGWWNPSHWLSKKN